MVNLFSGSRSSSALRLQALLSASAMGIVCSVVACGSETPVTPAKTIGQTLPTTKDAGSNTKCGNSLRDSAETCDDGNLVSGDGCSDTCQAEPSYVCEGAGMDSCVYRASAWVQQAYAKASNTEKEDAFGGTVALSADGNTLAVAAAFESSGADGVDSDQKDNSEKQAGAVYVFARVGGKWVQQAYVKASNSANYDSFGFSLALSADGNTLAVGADAESGAAVGVGGSQAIGANTNASGAVYVFQRAAGKWAQSAYVKASNTAEDDDFGASVALSADGNTLAVGAGGEDSSAVGVGGSQTDNKAVDSGAVYVFSRASAAATWAQQAYVKASNTGAGDKFGNSLALAGDGNTLVVGAYNEGSSALGVGGNQADNGAAKSGAVYIFSRAAAAWSQGVYVKASNTEKDDLFGAAVALSSDGKTLAVGATEEDSAAVGVGGVQSVNTVTDSGAVYVFALSGTTWSQQAYVKASNTRTIQRFGTALALSSNGTTLSVGAPGDDSSGKGVGANQTLGGAVYAGAIYEFRAAPSGWSQHSYVKASNTDASDAFGISVALSSDARTLAVGAVAEGSSAKGIDGNQADNTAAGAGATYLFAR